MTAFSALAASAIADDGANIVTASAAVNASASVSFLPVKITKTAVSVSCFATLSCFAKDYDYAAANISASLSASFSSRRVRTIKPQISCAATVSSNKEEIIKECAATALPSSSVIPSYVVIRQNSSQVSAASSASAGCVRARVSTAQASAGATALSSAFITAGGSAAIQTSSDVSVSAVKRVKALPNQISSTLTFSSSARYKWEDINDTSVTWTDV